MKKILLYSIVRNIENTIHRLYEQIIQIVEDHPEYEFMLSIYENDSTDRTKEILSYLDWSFVENSIVMENLNRPRFGSWAAEERVKNLAEARNKAIEAKDFLERSDYVLMIEGDMRFDFDVYDKILKFPDIEPDFHIVSAVTFLDDYDSLWDTWATRQNNQEDRGSLMNNWKDTAYDKYYSTSNGLCLYLSEPFKRGVRYDYINKTLNTWDCEMVVVCERFHELGYDNIYIRHDARGYCF